MSNQNQTAADNTLFTKNFLGRLKRVLDVKCAGGLACNRETVCQELSLDPKLFAGTISALINSGAVEGYEIKRGTYGGIGQKGVQRVLPEGVVINRPKKSDHFDPEFVQLVRDTLEEMTEEDPTAYVRRIDVARKMGMPGSDVENAISLAINTGKVAGYESKRGAGGGIRRAQPKQAGATVPSSSATLPSMAAVTVETAPPSQARPGIFKAKATPKAAPVSKRGRKAA